MDRELIEAIHNYQDAVTKMCQILLKHYKCKCKRELMGKLFCVNREQYLTIGDTVFFFHGRGCYATSSQLKVNWDFGYRGRWCGIDPFFLANYLKENGYMHSKYQDGNVIKDECKKAVESGEIFYKYGMYYLPISDDKKRKPAFPKEFDVLKIIDLDKEWSIPRNKEIIRFIRKATWVGEDIVNNPGRYILVFYLKEEEVYRIDYDDVNYPENAIKIMSDNIIRNRERICLNKTLQE